MAFGLTSRDMACAIAARVTFGAAMVRACVPGSRRAEAKSRRSDNAASSVRLRGQHQRTKHAACFFDYIEVFRKRQGPHLTLDHVSPAA